MLFNKMRQSSDERTCYSNAAQAYLKRNGLVLVQKLCDGILGDGELHEDKVKELLGENYPIAPWIEETDVIKQFVCLLEEAGYIFTYTENGKLYFRNIDLYNAIVQNHLKFSGRDILDRLAEGCEQFNGRIAYPQMQNILGFHYPKAPYVGTEDKRLCIILFLKAMGLPFNFDETYIYFP